MGYNAAEIYTSESNWLKAADLNRQEHTVTIERVDMTEIEDQQTGKKQRKLQLFFSGKDKALLLNKTNSDAISYAYTPETDNWLNRQIILYPTIVPFGDRQVEAIRVRPQLPQANAPQSAAQSFAESAPSNPEDDVPW